MKWIDFPDERLEVRGLPWFGEDSPGLRRLPSRMKDEFRPEVWNLGLQPSGGRIRFATDSSVLSVRAGYRLAVHMENMCRIGQAGMACYVGGRFARAPFPTEDELEASFFERRPREMAAVTVHLPLYHAVELAAFGFDDDAAVEPAPPFAVEKPVAFYGSSITQGGCASQPGNSYQAMLGRDLDIDFVNLGMSGNGRGEPEVARAFAEIDASCFVVDFAQNCLSVDDMRRDYGPFIETIRARHPETPVICVTPVFATSESWDAASRDRLSGMRDVVREAVADRASGGDRRIEVVEGYDLLGPGDADGLVDGVHPNDLGFRKMADGLREPVRRCLGL